MSGDWVVFDIGVLVLVAAVLRVVVLGAAACFALHLFLRAVVPKLLQMLLFAACLCSVLLAACALAPDTVCPQGSGGAWEAARHFVGVVDP